MRYIHSSRSGRRLRTKFFSLQATLILIVHSFSASLPLLLAQKAAAYSFPSTNAQNEANNHPHVTFVSNAPGKVTLDFINDTNSLAFFEYRLDGVTVGSTPHPVVSGDVEHPGISVDSRGIATPVVVRETFTAADFVEVRLALGGERDWDFDWTKFNVVPVLTPPAAASQTEQVVYQSDFANSMNTWTYHDDTASPLTAATPNPNATHSIDDNPTPTPGDSGAVKLSVLPGEKWNLASLQYSGTKLADIAALGFSVYTSSPGKAYINLDVDFNDPDATGYQGRLVYVPTGVSANTWSNQEAVASNGLWRWSNMITGANSEWPDGSTEAARPWNEIISAFPDATITAVNDVAFGSLYLRADGLSTTYYDHIYLATGSKNIRYNFEVPDTTAPLVELTAPNDGEAVNGTISVTGTVSDNTKLSHYTLALYPGSTDLSNGLPHASQIAVAGWGQTNTSSTLVNINKTLDTTTLSDGEYQIRLAARDAAGNRDVSDPFTGNTSSVHVIKITIDNTPPDVPVLLSPSNNALLNDGNDLVNDWQDVAGADHYVYQSFNVNPDGSCNLSSIRFTGPFSDSQTNSRDVSDLSFCWHVKAVDAAGNESAWSALWKVTVDMTAPLVAITNPDDGTVKGIVDIRGSVQDTNPHHYYLRIEDSGGSVVYEKVFNDPTSFTDKSLKSWDTNALPDGATYKIFLEARDAADNKDGSRAAPGDSVDVVTVTIDRSVAVPVQLSPVDNAVLTTAAQTLVDWEDVADPSGPVRYIYQVSGSPATAPDGSFVTPIWTTPLLADSEVGTAGTAEGVYYWHVKAVDALGNESAWSSTWKATIDNTSPVAAPTGSQTGTTLDGQLEANVTETNLGSFSWSLVSGPGTAVFGTPNDANTSVTVTDYGNYTFQVVVEDAAGNTTTETVAVTFNEPATTTTTDQTPQQLATPPVQLAAVGDAAPLGDGDVQGDNTDDETNDENDTSGTSTTSDSSVAGANDENNGCRKFLGLCWYYWIPIGLAIILVGYTVWRRRQVEEEA